MLKVEKKVLKVDKVDKKVLKIVKKMLKVDKVDRKVLKVDKVDKQVLKVDNKMLKIDQKLIKRCKNCKKMIKVDQKLVFGFLNLPFFSFWLFGPSCPFIFCLSGLPPFHKLPKKSNFNNFISAETGCILQFLAFWAFIFFHVGLLGFYFHSFRPFPTSFPFVLAFSGSFPFVLIF